MNEGSLSFGIFRGVANSCQYWRKRTGYAAKPHWEHGLEAVDQRDTEVFSGFSPGHELSRIRPRGRTGAGGRVSGVVNHVDWGRGGQKQGEDVCGDSSAERALLDRAVWEGGPGRAQLGESLANALKKNLLCPWSRCRIRLSGFCTSLLAIGW